MSDSSYTFQQTLQAARNLIEDAKRNGFKEETKEKITMQNTSNQKAVNTERKELDFSKLELIRAEIGDCTRCPLCKTRNHIVFGVGNPNADLVIVGEAPGRDEDKTGEPFVGRAGKLLTDILLAIGLPREEVYICNVVKCRPPKNRNPEPIEIETCEPFLKQQIAAIKPQLLLTLGKFATQTLLRTDTPISKLRGNFADYEGVPLMPTYHPAYLLRNPSAKKEVWEDVKKLHARLCEMTGKDLPIKGNK